MATSHPVFASGRAILRWPSGEEGGVRAARLASGDVAVSAVLAEIANPFGRALAQGVALNALLQRDPTAGNDTLAELVEATRAEIRAAMGLGFDGILYRLHGACERHCTPMQYGGFYLEPDRAILDSLPPSALSAIFVVGSSEVYVDFVSDLPADVFGWDSRATGISVESVRELRPAGLLCGPEDSSADVIWQGDADALLRLDAEAAHA